MYFSSSNYRVMALNSTTKKGFFFRCNLFGFLETSILLKSCILLQVSIRSPGKLNFRFDHLKFCTNHPLSILCLSKCVRPTQARIGLFVPRRFVLWTSLLPDYCYEKQRDYSTLTVFFCRHITIGSYESPIYLGGVEGRSVQLKGNRVITTLPTCSTAYASEQTPHKSEFTSLYIHTKKADTEKDLQMYFLLCNLPLLCFT